MSNNGHGELPPSLPPKPQPIDMLWAVLRKWGVTRTFENRLQVVEVILKKDELDRVIRHCYGLGVKVKK